MHLQEGPGRGVPMRSALLCARTLAPLAARPLAEVRQLLQADEAVRVGVHNAPTAQVVAI